MCRGLWLVVATYQGCGKYATYNLHRAGSRHQTCISTLLKILVCEAMTYNDHTNEVNKYYLGLTIEIVLIIKLLTLKCMSSLISWIELSHLLQKQDFKWNPNVDEENTFPQGPWIFVVFFFYKNIIMNLMLKVSFTKSKSQNLNLITNYHRKNSWI